MGKTAFAFALAKNISKRFNIGVAFFSLEMTHQQLIYRMLSTELGISSNRLKTGRLSKTEWLRINLAVSNLSKLPIYIHDNTNLRIDELQFRIKKLERQKSNNLGFIIIDYLQLIEGDNKAENRAQELASITRRLKKLARDLNLPILILSQLSRNVETRINKRPYLSDLRDSGCFNIISKKTYLTNWKNILVEKKKKILSWNGNFFIPNEISNFKYKGYKPVYILETNLGWTLFISANHKIFTQIGWKRIDQINLGDQLFLKLSIPKMFFYLKSLSWVFITKITYSKIDLVYDLEILNLSNYLTNRILIHNSIEQDADVVLMLYRDEYYNSSTSVKNVMEVIVSKHRNGPIGTAKLIFNPRYLRFDNINKN
jgi:replicative DNA helicase